MTRAGKIRWFNFTVAAICIAGAFLDFANLPWLFALVPAALNLAVFAYLMRRVARQQLANRTRPDYRRIATLEREIYGDER